jgi:hypothetical protein
MKSGTRFFVCLTFAGLVAYAGSAVTQQQPMRNSAMNPSIKRVERRDIEAILPPGFNLAAFESLGIISKYGWKLVEINGVKRISAATESDYRDSINAMRAQGLTVSDDADCYATGPVGCKGGPCFCHLWLNPKTNMWYCSC